MSKVAQSLLEEFGTAVKRARGLKGWQLKDLSNEMAGTSGVSFLSDIEKGKRSISIATVGRLIQALELDQYWIDRFMGIDPNATDQVNTEDEATQKAFESDEAKKLLDAGISEDAVIDLAQNFAEGISDLESAWLEVKRALKIALDVQSKGATGSNHQGFVDKVLRKVAALAREGDYAQASDAIDEALAQAEAEQVRLLDSGVEVALLDRNTEKAAMLLVRKADIEAGGIAKTNLLSDIGFEYYERGQSKGTSLDLQVALALSEEIVPRATELKALISILNLQGIALLALGEQKSNIALLERAISVLRKAIKECTPNDPPDGWTTLQCNLGTALSFLGEMQNNNALLTEALDCFKIALKQWGRKTDTANWAVTKVNQGKTLGFIAKRNKNPKEMEEAIRMSREALTELTFEKTPTYWGLAHLNMATTMSDLGETKQDHGLLRDSMESFRLAQRVHTLETAPLLWATIENNIGTSLMVIGRETDDTEMLRQAANAFELALEVRQRDRDPLGWADTKANLSNLELAYFAQTHDPNHFDKAFEYISEAKAMFLEIGAVLRHERAEAAIQNIQSNRHRFEEWKKRNSN